MRRGFLSGMIAGGLIGAAIGMMLAPQVSTDTRERIVSGGQGLSRTAQRLFRRSRDGVEDIIDDLKN